MADYRKIALHHPEVREYIRLRKWVHRGDAVAYGPNLEGRHLSTDAMGFRHSVFEGKRLSVGDCTRQERYGLVFGPSNVYGFGLPGNEATFPSVMGEQFGFPFGNVSFPEGTSRSAYSVLLNLITNAKRRPAAVLLLTGGDFTSFCYTGIADPVFGPPDLFSSDGAIKERAGKIDVRKEFGRLLAYSRLWTAAIISLCRQTGVPLAFGDDVTFFEKAAPSDYDLECRMGIGSTSRQEQQFAIHRALAKSFTDARFAQVQNAGVPIGGPGHGNRITYVDEFHYDAPGVRALSADFAPIVQQAMDARR